MPSLCCSRSVHAHWWEGSAGLLGHASLDLTQGGFGVTPAVLSTGAAVVTLASIQQGVGGAEDWRDTWIGQWGPGRW